VLDVVFHAPHTAFALGRAEAPPAGGSETQIIELSQALAAHGYRVGLVAYGRPGDLPERVNGVRLIPQRPPAGDRNPILRTARNSLATMRAVWRSDGAVVVQRTAGTATGVAGLTARLRRRTFVFSSSHVLDFAPSPRRGTRLAFDVGIRCARTIVVQSREQAELVRGRYGRAAVVVPSIARVPEVPRTAGRTFLWAARLHPHKRPELFVELARRLPEASFTLVAVNSGPYAARVAAELEQEARGVPNLTVLPSMPREELVALMGEAVAVVSTSVSEGMPNVFLEGWALGVPALSLVHDPDGIIGEHGLGWVTGDSLDELAARAAELWRTRAEPDPAVAERCREFVRRRHGSEAVVSRWGQVIGRPPA
jgi:glycosyltransferase involved in cell wall biosynthesis